MIRIFVRLGQVRDLKDLTNFAVPKVAAFIRTNFGCLTGNTTKVRPPMIEYLVSQGLLSEALTLCEREHNEKLVFEEDYSPEFSQRPSWEIKHGKYKYMLMYGLHVSFRNVPSQYLVLFLNNPRLFG